MHVEVRIRLFVGVSGDAYRIRARFLTGCFAIKPEVKCYNLSTIFSREQ